MGGGDARRPRILVVEDEWLVSDVLARELEDAGYEVIEVERADAALEILAGPVPIDLLFTDIRLPGALDGWDLAEEARRLRPDLPVIYATGYTTAEPRRVPGGVFFTKPYRAAAVIEAVRRLGLEPA